MTTNNTQQAAALAEINTLAQQLAQLHPLAADAMRVRAERNRLVAAFLRTFVLPELAAPTSRPGVATP